MMHRSLKRTFHRIFEEFRATCKISRRMGLINGIITLNAKIDIQKMNRDGFQETLKRKKHLLKKHEIMLEYLAQDYDDFFKNYNLCKESNKTNTNIIWMCWWQGIDNAPLIIRKCYESVLKHTKGYRVILITNENYKDYVTFPNWLLEKYNKGYLSKTHLSDVLRFELLAKYGGIWLDSTFFCSSDSIVDLFKLPFWSIKRPDYLHCSIASGYFANYSFGCSSENKWIFRLIADLILFYWKKNDMIIDYLLTDYLIVLAENEFPEIKDIFDKIPVNNQHCDELYVNLNNQFDLDKWKKLQENTCLFKLSWKKEYIENSNNNRTFYWYLINNNLIGE